MQCARAYRDSWANGYERRHLFNASKYVCSLAVVVLSFFSSKSDSLRIAWWAVSISSTIFALAWDFRMDWGHPGFVVGAFKSCERMSRSASHARLPGNHAQSHAASHASCASSRDTSPMGKRRGGGGRPEQLHVEEGRDTSPSKRNISPDRWSNQADGGSRYATPVVERRISGQLGSPAYAPAVPCGPYAPAAAHSQAASHASLLPGGTQGAAPATINLAEAGALSGNFGPQRQHSADYSIGGLSGGSGSRHGSSASLSTLGQQHAEDRGALDAPRMRHYPLWAFSMAAVTNTIARLGWAVYISPGQQVVQQHVILLLGCVELLRRAQWAAFRLEWEHHNRSAKAAADKTAAEAKALAEAQQRWENLQWERHRRMPFGF